MKDNEITSFDKELNKFLQPKCLIPGGLGLWETYFRKICTAWGRIDSEISFVTLTIFLMKLWM